VPFSSYWHDPNVKFNGYVLTSLALMLSLVKGQPQGTGEAIKQIGDWKESPPMELRNFAPTHLPLLRKNILSAAAQVVAPGKKQISIWGIDSTIAALRAWKLRAENSTYEQQRLPLKLGEDPICVEILDQQAGRIHLIHVSSMFSDFLHFKKPNDGAPVDAIIQELEGNWIGPSNLHPIRSSYEIASKAIYGYMPDANEEEEQKKKLAHWGEKKRGSPLKRKLIEEFEVAENSERFYFVLRLAIIFAWVRALYVRKVQGETQYTLAECVYHFLGCDRLGESAPKDYNRLLGEETGGIVRVSNARYREPFKNADDLTALEAYSLDAEEGVVLSDLEKTLCQIYVEDKDVCLKDDEDDRPDWERVRWPAWMKPHRD
jgi:hypothetical protein